MSTQGTGGTAEGQPDALSELTEKAVSLSQSLKGPLKRIALSRGEITVEVDWQEAPTTVVAAPGTAVAATTSVVLPDTTAAAEAEAAAGGHSVRAPLVGTFYAAPSPDEAPFVSPGDTVTVGQTLGIIEAMKLMNSIVSDVAGRVVEVLVENGTPVEFDQPLVLIEPVGAEVPDAVKVG
ncbi:hypothetical protein GCM10027586_04000 [Kineococcus gypseus]|uniref:acetyl-CoA carboxylase biotin carboxyl carrier protein n=1 Tax=Kineococcus gypseus TaxID=1637102 RepID=UPI003D7D552C